MKSPKKEGPTAEETALKEVGVATWNDYSARYRPAEAALVKEAELTAGERASVKGQANADVAGAFKELTRNTIASGGVAGANVNSGKTKLGLAGDAASRGAATGGAAALAETGAEVDRDQQQLGIAATGRNIAHDATANMARGARRATSLALASSQARFERNASNVDALAAVAGAATRKFKGIHDAKKAAQQPELINSDFSHLRRQQSLADQDPFNPALTRNLA